MKIFGKILAVIGYIPLRTIGLLMEILAKLSCYAAGPFLVFVIGCGIYCAVKTQWRDLAILAAVAGAVALFYVLAGLLIGLIGIAGDRVGRFIRS